MRFGHRVGVLASVRRRQPLIARFGLGLVELAVDLVLPWQALLGVFRRGEGVTGPEPAF